MNESSGNKNQALNKVKPLLSSPPMFDHEKLDVYQLELQFIAWATDLLEEVSKSAKGKTAEVCDQLDRAIEDEDEEEELIWTPSKLKS